MIIVVNHLTRMRQDHVCVAGVDLDTGRHIRPVTKWGAVTADILARNQGPFDIANVVDLGPTEPTPQKPHVEDYSFKQWRTRFLEGFRHEDFWGLLYSVSATKLEDIFGRDLRRIGRFSCGTDAGKGEASLGCLRPASPPCLFCRARGSSGKMQIRIRFSDGRFDVDVGVTDLRLYKDDHATPDRRMVAEISERLEGRGAVILAVGLTRAYVSSAEHTGRPIHWLQVNNIHLADDPIWRLG